MKLHEIINSGAKRFKHSKMRDGSYLAYDNELDKNIVFYDSAEDKILDNPFLNYNDLTRDDWEEVKEYKYILLKKLDDKYSILDLIGVWDNEQICLDFKCRTANPRLYIGPIKIEV